MGKDVEKKRRQEKEVISRMVGLYCRTKHKTKNGLCPDCEAMEAYAWQRSDRCPFMETKTFCANCEVHCYRPEMREKIRKIMRLAGPRMLVRHPVITIHHAITSLTEKKRMEKTV